MAKIQLRVEIPCSILNNKIWIRVTSPKRHFMRASICDKRHFFRLRKSVTWPKTIGEGTSRCTVAKWRVALENYPYNLKIRYLTQYIRYLAFLIRNFFGQNWLKDNTYIIFISNNGNFKISFSLFSWSKKRLSTK